ncbi:MAG TPA: site-specific integrase [Terriglobales bacterium]|nr:site-specific integrase [Terriglobales bacterium]
MPTPVSVLLPSTVADALRTVPQGPNANPRYFFWNGASRNSIVKGFGKAFRRLFEIADIRNADGTQKRCHPHMLRDTFAVENLLAEVPIDQVSKLLGHSSVKITEKHYAPWVPARQQQLENSLRKALMAQGMLDAGPACGAASKEAAV